MLLYPAPLRLRWSSTLRERKWYWTWKERHIDPSLWSFIAKLLLFPLQPVSYQDVALVFVVVEWPVVNHMACSCPGVGQQMLHEVLPFCEIPHGSVLQHAPALIVAVHRPDLKEGNKENRRFTSILKTEHPSKTKSCWFCKETHNGRPPSSPATWLDNYMVFWSWLILKLCPRWPPAQIQPTKSRQIRDSKPNSSKLPSEQRLSNQSLATVNGHSRSVKLLVKRLESCTSLNCFSYTRNKNNSIIFNVRCKR